MRLMRTLVVFVICIGVVEIPCPNAMVAKLTSFRSERAASDGLTSPANSTPVGVPKPKFRTYL